MFPCPEVVLLWRGIEHCRKRPESCKWTLEWSQMNTWMIRNERLNDHDWPLEWSWYNAWITPIKTGTRYTGNSNSMIEVHRAIDLTSKSPWELLCSSVEIFDFVPYSKLHQTRGIPVFVHVQVHLQRLELPFCHYFPSWWSLLMFSYCLCSLMFSWMTACFSAGSEFFSVIVQ